MAQSPHKTAHEIEYINSMGTNITPIDERKSKKGLTINERIAWLESYLKVADIRANWEGIDRDKVTAYVRNKIAQLREHS